MAVEVALIGRLGNNLFQYALGRIIAETLGFGLVCRQIPLPETHLSHQLALGPSTLKACAHVLPAAPFILRGRNCVYPVEAHTMRPGSGWAGQTLDLAGVLNNRMPRCIRLAGYFQQAAFYLPHRDRIRQWFTVVPGPTLVAPAPSDVLVNVRRGADYDAKGWTLPLDYYAEAIRALGRVGRVYVAGVGIDPTTRDFFDRYDPIYLEGNPIEHLRTFRHFSRFVLSNSTFSWWTAFLAEAREIVGPEAAPGSGIFALHGFPDVDLRFPSDYYRPVFVTSPISSLGRN